MLQVAFTLSFLLAVILYSQGRYALSMLVIIISSVAAYFVYRKRLGLSRLYNHMPYWFFALLLEGGLCLAPYNGVAVMFLSLGIGIIAVIGIYETWSHLQKDLALLPHGAFVCTFVAAFFLFIAGNPYCLVTGAVLVIYGILGFRAVRLSLDKGTSHVRGMAFLSANSSKAFYGNSLSLGGVSLPGGLETHHFLIAGRTGSGKTLGVNELLRGVRARGDRAIIADPGGGYVSRFFKEGDIILNPFDKRGVAWSPFIEVRSNYDFGRLARSVIPDAVGDAQDWHQQAQNLFALVMRRLYEKGEGHVSELLRLLTAASVSELKPILAGSVGEQLTHSGNEKLLSNTRGILSSYLTPWENLHTESEPFSIRDWVSKESSGWLFLTYRDDQLADLRFLISTWMDLAIVEGLSLEESITRRLWYVMDELDSLGKINTLKDGLTKLRKYGGCCIAGLQTIAQLRHTYGHHEAQTLLSCMATKLILTAGDTETAEYFSRELGQREVVRREKSFAENLAKTISERHHLEWAVLPSEISSLKIREGFLRITGTSEIARVEVPLVSMPSLTTPFVQKHAFA